MITCFFVYFSTARPLLILMEIDDLFESEIVCRFHVILYYNVAMKVQKHASQLQFFLIYLFFQRKTKQSNILWKICYKGRKVEGSFQNLGVFSFLSKIKICQGNLLRHKSRRIFLNFNWCLNLFH